MSYLLVYGNFGFDSQGQFNGQSVKTRNVYKVLSDKFGSNNVAIFNYEHWHKRPISTLFSFCRAFKNAKQLVILPGDNNIVWLLKLMPFLRLFNEKAPIYYSVIGGWIFNKVNKKPKLIKRLGKFAGIFVEAKKMKTDLESLGLKNVYHSPIFTLRAPLSQSTIDESIKTLETTKECKICTFSRVAKEKGITLAINAVKSINEKAGTNMCKLDIFGMIGGTNYETEFYQLLKENKDFVTYKGPVDQDALVILSKYSFCLFPTYFWGEGYPTAVIECFMAGLPVIASDWKYNPELIVDGKNGFLCKTNDLDDLIQKTSRLVNNKQEALKMHLTTFEYSQNFSPEKSLSKLLTMIKSMPLPQEDK